MIINNFMEALLVKRGMDWQKGFDLGMQYMQVKL